VRYKLKDLSLTKLEYGSGAAACGFDGETRYVRITDIDENGTLNDDVVSPSQYDDKYILQNGDILFARTGATVGKTFLYDESYGKCLYAGFLIRMVPNQKIVNPYYIYYFTKSPRYLAFIEKNMKVVAQPNINAKQYGELDIDIPELGEQETVVRKLNKLSSLISLRKQQLSKLDELVKSRFIEMFGDTILNPFGWEKDNFGTVCDVRDGTHDSPQYYETGYPLVTSKNVTGGKIDLTDCSLICEADFKKINERSKVDMGDIIMPMIGTVGKPVIVDIEPNFAIKNVSLIKFKATSRVLNIYIRALLQSDYFDDVVLSKVRGGTQKFISLGDIRKLEILVPPIVMQKQFAAFVEQTDKSKFEIQKSLEKLETLKKALMQKYFG